MGGRYLGGLLTLMPKGAQLGGRKAARRTMVARNGRLALADRPLLQSITRLLSTDYAGKILCGLCELLGTSPSLGRGQQGYFEEIGLAHHKKSVVRKYDGC